MPESKKPLIRYQVIDRCIRNPGRKYSFVDLMEEVNNELAYRNLDPIGKTTFYQDIKDMELEFQAPIETYWEGRRKYYRYSDPVYSFGNQPLNQEEIEHMKDAVLILGRFGGIPGFEWIDEVTAKLELGTFEKVGDPNVISFQSNEFLKGKEFIGPLFKAILDKKVVEVTYQAFTSDKEKFHVIHPYHLKEYDDRWYVLGHYPLKDTLMTLSVDRINSMRIREEEAYIENCTYDFIEYFEDLIGIWKEEGREAICMELKFTPLMAKYVRTKPIHGSQKTVCEEEDGSLVISIEVIPNHEVENLIFSFKDGVEVLEPQDFREKLGDVYRKVSGYYD